MGQRVSEAHFCHMAAIQRRVTEDMLKLSVGKTAVFAAANQRY